ncbi:MAG: dCTP deaminase [Acidobacteria bacterium]|nr:dCTP deaminase [Acidobacteriota bacterium]
MGEPSDPLVITPQTVDLEKLNQSGSASINLRLGTWFVQLQQTRKSVLQLPKKGETADETGLVRPFYIRFGSSFYLHPRTFLLGVTLEWIRLPKTLAGYLIGRSSWGRRGLIIATAAGVHPGFTGCLTLELTNVGEMPIEIRPGLEICQLFLHETKGRGTDVDQSKLVGLRRPTLSKIQPDEVAEKLAKELSP